MSRSGSLVWSVAWLATDLQQPRSNPSLIMKWKLFHNLGNWRGPFNRLCSLKLVKIAVFYSRRTIMGVWKSSINIPECLPPQIGARACVCVRVFVRPRFSAACILLAGRSWLVDNIIVVGVHSSAVIFGDGDGLVLVRATRRTARGSRPE